MPENISFNQNSQEKTVEQKKQDVVKLLKDFSSKITDFNLMTSTNSMHSGFWSTNEKKQAQPVKYDERYKDEFEIVPFKEGVSLDGLLYKRENSYYIFDKPVNKVTFCVELGRVLCDDRNGNIFWITIRFAKDDKTDKTELLKKITELLKTVGCHYGKGIKEDRYKIAKEGLPVLEAFEEVAVKHEDSESRITIDSLVNEYKKIINEYENH